MSQFEILRAPAKLLSDCDTDSVKSESWCWCSPGTGKTLDSDITELHWHWGNQVFVGIWKSCLRTDCLQQLNKTQKIDESETNIQQQGEIDWIFCQCEDSNQWNHLFEIEILLFSTFELFLWASEVGRNCDSLCLKGIIFSDLILSVTMSLTDSTVSLDKKSSFSDSSQV